MCASVCLCVRVCVCVCPSVFVCAWYRCHNGFYLIFVTVYFYLHNNIIDVQIKINEMRMKSVLRGL